MQTLKTLTFRTKLLIAVSSAALLLIALGLLFFGHNALGHENELIHQAAEATRADMLYSHPESH